MTEQTDDLVTVPEEFSPGGNVYPFVTDENGNLTGSGWQDVNLFADRANAFYADEAREIADLRNAPILFEPGDVEHLWVVWDTETGERATSSWQRSEVGDKQPAFRAEKVTWAASPV